MRVEVVFCPRPGDCRSVALILADGSTLADALVAGGLDAAGLRTGIWGRPCPPETPLRDRDRVELYRPLQVDPMEARRRRQRLQTDTSAR